MNAGERRLINTSNERIVVSFFEEGHGPVTMSSTRRHRSYPVPATREILRAQKRRQGVAGDRSGPWRPRNSLDAAAPRKEVREVIGATGGTGIIMEHGPVA
jgi:hypothetical protein